MANNHSTLTSLFKDIADAIRGRTGGTEPIQADAFPSAIRAINTEGLGSPGDYQALRGMIDTTFSGNYTNYSVKHIYSYAMSYCTKMENLSFPECLTCDPYTFNNITSLKNITLPKISLLPDYTFAGCTNLSEVYIQNCKSLSTKVFDSLKKISRIFADSLEYIGSSAFQSASIGSLYAPNVKGIWQYGLYNCNIEHVSFPNVEYIGGGAFAYCKIKEIELPNIRIIRAHEMFKGCNQLSYVSIGSKFTGDNPLVIQPPFEAMESFTDWTRTSNMFLDCTSLLQFDAPELLYLYYEMFRNCYKLETVNAPKVTHIHDAFNYCSSLKSAYFPECVSIGYGDQTFWSCTGLQTVHLPKCSYFDGYVFGNCYSLKELSLPAAVRFSNSSIFHHCHSLSRMILLGSSVVTLTHSTAFNFTPITDISYLGYFGSIYVPGSMVSLYQVAPNWSFLSSRIAEYTGL